MTLEDTLRTVMQPPESEFYLIELDDTYLAKKDVRIEVNGNDYDYPLALTTQYPTGQEFGVVLTRADIQRLLLEAKLLGIQ